MGFTVFDIGTVLVKHPYLNLTNQHFSCSSKKNLEFDSRAKLVDNLHHLMKLLRKDGTMHFKNA